ncbi:prephenate dehydratase [Herbihabitans rhizosphaerae]|uniref:Prephenate dehydratase n=1 Tax=Herbihabitans rhizosphaerae TaxID=1872711 RepID=A0A4Q7L7G1_9PSEU|nr:prephenate dehydratase [Herbihabitans rhizosphaerae]RZS45214.1 prephenate dehydratase [Herbihabitans rhizosphaerae]
MPRIAYFGPQGTFTEQAARAFATNGSDELVPVATVPEALAAVRAEKADAACVPLESSVQGSVPDTMDGLAVDEPLVAVGEQVIPIRFTVLTRPGMARHEIRTVASHPHALGQVSRWLAENLPSAAPVAATSTAAAAVDVTEGRYDAAVTAPVAAEHYPLDVLATDLADVRDAVTRFLLLRRPGPVRPPTGADRTSLIVEPDSFRTGSLAELLTELAECGINLSRIESRPKRGRLGEYRFYLDFDGHIAERRVGDALAALYRRCREVRFLGSYPNADASMAVVPPNNTDQAYADADAWLDGVRSGRSA